MELTLELVEELRKIFDKEYVRITDCNDIQDNNTKKFANDDKRIDLILVEQKHIRAEQKSGFTFNNWLTGAILGILVAGVIAYLFMNFGS